MNQFNIVIWILINYIPFVLFCVWNFDDPFHDMS